MSSQKTPPKAEESEQPVEFEQGCVRFLRRDEVCQPHVNRSTVIRILLAKGISIADVEMNLNQLPTCSHQQCLASELKELYKK